MLRRWLSRSLERGTGTHRDPLTHISQHSTSLEGRRQHQQQPHHRQRPPRHGPMCIVPRTTTCLFPWLAPILLLLPPFPPCRVLYLYICSLVLFNENLSLSLSLCIYMCVCRCASFGSVCSGLWRGILVNDSGANTARGNIKNVPWDSVGLEEVWRQKRCWHPPPPTMPCNT